MGMSTNICKESRTSLLMILFFVLLSRSYAQESLSTMRSNVIREIDGKEYYIHTIRKGQSLYMISKAYGMDVNDVIRENPEVKEGIEPGQKIKIPANKLEEPPAPKKEVKPVVKEEPKPVVKEEPKPAEQQVEPAVEPPVITPEPLLPCGSDAASKKGQYDVALMIPLYLDEIDQMNVDNPPPDMDEVYNPLRFVQFYEGFRMAVDSMSKTGMAMRIHVYDAVRDTLKTRKLLARPEMKKMDLIIGLVYQKDFEMIAAFGQKNSIPVVNPISERGKIIEGNPMVIKVRPSLTSQAPELAEYLSGSFPDANFIIIRDAHFKDSPEPDDLKKACTDKSLNVNLFDGYSKVFEVLSKEKENVLVLFSDNKVFSLEFLTKMNEFRNEYRLTVVGMPKWDEMEGLEPEYLVNMKTRMMANSFVDYDDAGVKSFITGFRERYKTEPELLAFEGFDVSCFFLSALAKYGKAITLCLADFRMHALQTDFQFSQVGGNGFENQHWVIYTYENYQVKKVNEQ
jgi:hypothetical protein